MSKEKIEAATVRVAKGIRGLVQAFEQSGAALTDEQFEKVFSYLQLLVQSGRDQAKAARIISIGAADSFSVDMELPKAAPAVVMRERFVKGTDVPRQKPDDLVNDCGFIDDDEPDFMS